MSIFEEVKQHLKIRQVVEFYGYKVGRANNFVCPFHQDTHPSAFIKNDFFNCFVCGAGGDVITFTSKLHGLNNYEASKRLISDFNLPIDTNTPISQKERLKADRERHNRMLEQKKREELEALVSYTEDVLAKYHRYLWRNRLADVNSIEYERSCKYLAQAQYYLDCFDNSREEYSKMKRKEVRKIEGDLFRWHNQDQRT